MRTAQGATSSRDAAHADAPGRSSPHRVVLTIEPVDTSGRALQLTTVRSAHAAVASRAVALDHVDVDVELEVLAASHRIRARHRPSGDELHETVACAARVTAPPMRSYLLAPRAGWVEGGWRASFRSELVVGATSVRAASAEIEAALARSAGLAVQFPGGRDALTAVAVDEAARGAIGWSTWHLYPGADPHVVRTRTTARWG